VGRNIFPPELLVAMLSPYMSRTSSGEIDRMAPVSCYGLPASCHGVSVNRDGVLADYDGVPVRYDGVPVD
jgi:hypothetical protein